MAGIRPLSPADLRFTAPSPPRPARLAPPPREERPEDALDLSPDGKALSRAILLKVALEGKDFQTARREVLAEFREGGAVPPAPAPMAVTGASMNLDAVRVDWEHLEVDIQSEGGSMHLEVTRLRVKASHVAATAARRGPGAKQDPLLLDLDGNGAATTGAQGARAFDLAGDGDHRLTSFVAGGDAFLALDRDGDGRIASGLELFGDQHGAADGYEELRTFDGNQDGVIDAADPVYRQLQLLHGDGRTEHIQDAGIAALSLDARAQDTTTGSGDAILRRATAVRTDGSTLDTYALGLRRFDAVG